MKIISSTTIDNYNKYFFDDDFHKISINEPNDEELNSIVRNVIINYCVSTKVMLTFENLDMLINNLTNAIF